MGIMGMSYGGTHKRHWRAWFACRYPWCDERLLSESGYPPQCPVHDLPMVKEG